MRIAAKTVPPKARSTAPRSSPKPVKDAVQTPFETAGSSRRRARKPRPKHRSEGPGGAVDLPGRAFGNTRDRLGEARPRRPSGCLGAARSCPAGRRQGRPELAPPGGFQGATGHALHTHRRCRRERPWPITPPNAPQSRQQRAAGRGGGVTRRTARRRPGGLLEGRRRPGKRLPTPPAGSASAGADGTRAFESPKAGRYLPLLLGPLSEAASSRSGWSRGLPGGAGRGPRGAASGPLRDPPGSVGSGVRPTLP